MCLYDLQKPLNTPYFGEGSMVLSHHGQGCPVCDARSLEHHIYYVQLNAVSYIICAL